MQLFFPKIIQDSTSIIDDRLKLRNYTCIKSSVILDFDVGYIIIKISISELQLLLTIFIYSFTFFKPWFTLKEAALTSKEM